MACPAFTFMIGKMHFIWNSTESFCSCGKPHTRTRSPYPHYGHTFWQCIMICTRVLNVWTSLVHIQIHTRSRSDEGRYDIRNGYDRIKNEYCIQNARTVHSAQHNEIKGECECQFIHGFSRRSGNAFQCIHNANLSRSSWNAQNNGIMYTVLCNNVHSIAGAVGCWLLLTMWHVCVPTPHCPTFHVQKCVHADSLSSNVNARRSGGRKVKPNCHKYANI